MAGLGGAIQRVFEALLSWTGLIATAFAQVLIVGLLIQFGQSGDPDDGAAMAVIWQVHAAFASIGFAGLAIAFQVLGDPPLTAGSARHSVVSDMRFGRLLASGIYASLILGALSLWAASPSTVVAAFLLVLLPSVVLVGAAYARLAILFTSSPYVERLTLVELKVRVRGAAAAAVTQERIESKLEREIDEARGLVSGLLPSAGGLGLRRLKNPHFGRVVSTIDVGPMVHAADQLAWAAHVAATGGGFDSYEYPQRISVRVRPNRLYRPGDTLFEMRDWPGIPEPEWDAISRKLLSSIRFSTDQSGDAAHIFVEDMSALQDSVLAAVRDHQISRTSRGYRYYQEAIHEARSSTGTIGMGLNDPQWFERQIWEIDEAASCASHRIALVAANDAERMAFDAVKTEDLFWLRIALRRLEHIWAALVQSPEAGAKNVRENVIVTMQNIAELAIPFSFTLDHASEEATRQIVWSYTTIAKTSIDAGSAVTAERVAGYLSVLFDVTFAPNAQQLSVDVGLAQSVVLGWALFTDEGGNSDEQLRLSAFKRRHHLPDALSVLRAYDKYRDEGPWRWWESKDALPLQTYVARFEGYFQSAVLLLLADRKLRLVAGSATWDDRHILQATRSAADSVRNFWMRNRSQAEHLDQAVEALERELRRLDNEQVRRLAETDISAARVQEFHDAIVETMTSGPRLATFLRAPELQDSSEAAGQALLGRELHGLPKTFFIVSEVIADPSQVGHEVGAALLREQDYRLLIVLLAGQGPVRVAPDRLLSYVSETAQSLSDPVLVYNGQGEIETLLDLDFTDSGRVVLAGHEAFAMFVGQGLPKGDVVLVDRASVPALAFSPEPSEALTAIDEVHLAVGLREEEADVEGRRTMTIEYGQVMQWGRSNPVAVAIEVYEDRTGTAPAETETSPE